MTVIPLQVTPASAAVSPAVKFTLVSDKERPSQRKRRAYVPTGVVGQHMARAQELKIQMDRLKVQVEEERQWFIEHLLSRDLSVLELGDFQIERRTTSKWTYSTATEREQQALKVTQKWEQKQGIATNDPTVSCAFVIRTRKKA